MKLMLGKLPAKKDRRTIAMKSILQKRLPTIPPSYDVDKAFPGCDTPMYLNDRLGDCVIAGRAHQTRRFELVEHRKVIKITDTEVKKEYFAESGGQDSGLVMQDSLKDWRKGWKAAGKMYTIDAFASIHTIDPNEIKACIFLLTGCYAGVALPMSAQKQMGKCWDITTGRDAIKGSWGGHCIYLCAYNMTGPVCITWGARQQMSWDWFFVYADEAYGVVDSLDSWSSKQAIDVPKLEGYLREISR